MDAIPFVIAGIFGAFIGSFLNVCIHRLPRNESVVQPGSRCYGCGTWVQWYDNLPLISYLLLRGRCRWCGSPFSIRYWLLEVLTAVLTALTMWWVFRGPAAIVPTWTADTLWSRALAGGVLLVFVYAAVVASVIDLTWLIIPDEVAKPLLVAAPLLALGIGINRHLGWDVAPWFTGGVGSWRVGPGLSRIWSLAAPAIVALPLSLLLARRIYRRCRLSGENWSEDDFRGLRVGVLFYVVLMTVLLIAATLLVALANRWPALCDPTLCLLQGLLGSLSAWWLLWGIGLGGSVLFRRNAMGYGDVKFFAGFGFLLGPMGVVAAFIAAALCACCISLPAKFLSRERELPFGPYLAVGAAVIVVWGGDLLGLANRFLP